MSHVVSFFFGILLLIEPACTQDTGPYIITEVYSVDSVEVLHSSVPELQFKISATVPNPCHEFSYYLHKQDGRRIEISIFSQIKKGITCIQMLGKIETDIHIRLKKAGDYSILFKGRSKDKTISLIVEE